MRIIDEEGHEIQEKDVDYDLGYLEPDKLFIKHHDEIPEVKEEFHYHMTKREHGGGLVEKIIDVPYSPAVPAWDEYEDIMRYKLYNSYELAQRRIAELKQMLSDTDYCVIKIAEGSAERSEYQHVIDQREAWRAEINELEELNEGV